MKAKINLWMLGIAAMLASCSSEDALQTDNNGGVVRITAQLADDMKTRAVTEEGVAEENAGIDNYVLEVYTVDNQGVETKDEDLSGTSTDGVFALKLDRHKNYRFYCWADEGDESSYGTSNGLANITLKSGSTPTIAHRGQTEVVSGESSGDITIQMTHAVAKVVLKTTGTLNANTVQLSTNTYSAYNALTGEVTGDATATVTATGPDADITTASTAAPEEALSFYTLVNEADFPVTINYTTTPGDFSNPYSKSFTHAPFQADYRTIFIGDIAGLQYNNVSVTATLDENWDEDINIKLSDATFDVNTHTITTYLKGQIAGNPKLIESAIGTGNTLIIEGPMDDTDIEALKTYLVANPDAALELDLSKVTKLTTFPYYGFSQYDNGSTLGLKSIVLPDVMTKIDGNAFRGYCTNLESVTLPAGLKEIEGAAFSYCSKLSTIKVAGKETINELPEGLVTLKDAAFRSTKLETITIPSSLTTVTLSTLRGMASLKTVYWNSSVAVPSECFSECTSLEDIYFTSETAPSVGNNVGNNIFGLLTQKITIHIPAKYEDNYSAWKALETNGRGWNITCVAE